MLQYDEIFRSDNMPALRELFPADAQVGQRKPTRLIIAMDIMCWNMRGLNTTARRDNVRTLVADVRPHIVCLVETKLQSVNPWLVCLV